jgi:hypothetical protein
LKPHRGLTFITVLLIAALVGGVYWVATFGGAYWDNQEVKADMKEAANLCYHELDNSKIQSFMMRKLHSKFDAQQEGGKTAMVIDFDPADLRVERTASPKWVHIYLTYSRVVRTPLLGQERNVTFVDHAEADLSDVKW